MTTFEDFVHLEPREVPLGGPRGMTVHRTLPARRTSLIGAWCFVDHFGPDDVSATDGMRVARHPHTGLATVSWLFEGAITHRDSLGSHALVRPGDLDLMVAGPGITHSEFSALDTTVLHGVQLWYALPDRARFGEREFTVHSPEEVRTGTARARVGLGALRAVDGDGASLEDTSPVTTATALGMAQLDLRAGSTLRLDLDPGHEHGLLVDRGTALLAPFTDAAHHYAHGHLTGVGVEVRLGTGVAAVHPDRVELDDGTAIPTRTVVWGGGESAAPIVLDAGVPTGRGGRVDVAADLGVPGLPGVYAVGDAANIPGPDGRTLPQLGSVAQQSGRAAGANVLRERRGAPTEPFRYKDKGIMAMIGRNAAVAEVGHRHHTVEGPVAFAAWLGVHAMLLSGAHSKTDAFLSWAWDYFDRDHSALVEMTDAPHRIAWEDTTADVPHIDPGT
jgi:redox-sensitive bicupin YhaK (pirin superfamily)